MRGDKPAYKLFTQKGKSTDYGQLVKAASKADVVLFGELHNNPISHWLQYELTSSLYAAKNNKLVLGAEMFEADNAMVLDEYLAGKITERNFEAEARLWPNYKTDYKPLITFARDSGLRFIATNIPRRYASLVHRQGFEGLETLSDEARQFIAPLPIAYDPELPGYKQMLEMMGGASGHVNENLPRAQAVKDATMAYFILKNLKPGETFLHFQGTYHSDNFEGISWYLRQSAPDLKIITISSCEQTSLDTLATENKNKADFILVIPESMTKTH
ncbi:ChaN family lipoprotein [Lentimicrobium sp.]